MPTYNTKPKIFSRRKKRYEGFLQEDRPRACAGHGRSHATGERIPAADTATFISGVAVKDGSNVVTVTMFEELEQETDYIISYKGKEASLTTIKNIAEGIKLYVSGREAVQKGQTKISIDAKLLATGPNGQKVDITGCKDYTGWGSNLDLEDRNPTKQNIEYMCDITMREVWFYTDEPTFVVNLKGTFTDWYAASGAKYSDALTVNANSDNINVTLGDWCVANYRTYHKDADWNKKVFAADQENILPPPVYCNMDRRQGKSNQDFAGSQVIYC